MKLSIFDLEMIRDGVECVVNEREKNYLDADDTSSCYTMYMEKYEQAHNLLVKIDLELNLRKGKEE